MVAFYAIHKIQISMADSLHNALQTFRNSMLTSIACLEFQLRDTLYPCSSTYACPSIHAESSSSSSSSSAESHDSFHGLVQDLAERMTSLESYVKSIVQQKTQVSMEHDLLNMEQNLNTRNILIASPLGTPALAAAVAAANPPDFTLSEKEEDEEDEEDEDEDEEDEDEEEEPSIEEETLKKVLIRGNVYYIDSNSAVYHETEDGYEEIGVYNSTKDSIEYLEQLKDEEKEEGEEIDEEAIEVEEFTYKGNTYQRDTTTNIVYMEDGTEIGTWDGKRIISNLNN